MNAILLTSENFIKSVCSISDNISGKYMLPAIREAQEIDLKSVVGAKLLERIKQMIEDGSIKSPENQPYKDLLDKVQYYLAYTVISRLCVLTSFKLDNAGVNRATDENMEPVPIGEVYNLKEYYQKKADYYCLEIQLYILDNKGKYPELSEKECRRINANLYSAASGGLWLGGARGIRR